MVSDAVLQFIHLTTALASDLSDMIDYDSELLYSSDSDLFSNAKVSDNGIFLSLESLCATQGNFDDQQSLVARD